MKLNKDGFLAKYLKKTIEMEARKNREKPITPFVGEKKQLWYFLMNQIDQKSPEDGDEQGETQD